MSWSRGLHCCLVNATAYNRLPSALHGPSVIFAHFQLFGFLSSHRYSVLYIGLSLVELLLAGLHKKLVGNSDHVYVR